MAFLIEDENVERDIERLAADLRVSPAEAVKRAVRDHAAKGEAVSAISSERFEQRMKAIHEAQSWFAAHRHPNDPRTPDEIIGYNEDGLFD